MKSPREFVVRARRSYRLPPRILFDCWVDDENFFALRPTALEHRDVSPSANGGHSCTQVYEVNGKQVTQQSRTVEFVDGQTVVDEVTTEFGRAISTIHFRGTASGATVEQTQEVFVNWQITWRQRQLAMKAARHNLRRSLELLEAVASSADTDGA